MSDRAIKILGQIRDELKSTRTELSSRLDVTNQRLDETNRRLAETNQRLKHCLSTELVAVTAAIGDLKKVIVEDRKLRAQVSDHENRLKVLERKKAS